MNIHSKVARNALVIFSVLVCGGWYSDSRANYENVNYISEFFVYKVGEERNTNTVQNGQQGKLILAQRQGDKRKKRRTGVSKGKVKGPPKGADRGRKDKARGKGDEDQLDRQSRKEERCKNRRSSVGQGCTKIDFLKIE
jgi:hypothetical protein